MLKSVLFGLLFATFVSSSTDVAEMDLCYSPVDIIQVQDMTSSFDNRWPIMSKQIGDVINSIYEINPNSRFGFATFGDKPFYPLGYNSDYCLHVDIQLSQPTSQLMTNLFENYKDNAQGGGADWPEAVLDGLQRSLIAPQIGWDTRTNSSKVIVVVTDATSHLPGDVARLAGLNLSENDLNKNDLLTNENNKCNQLEYPSFQSVANIIKNTGAEVIFIVAPGGSFDSNGKFSPAASLANYGKKYWNEDGLKLWYEDQFNSVGIKIIVETMDQEMSVYSDAFKTALERYQAWRCAVSTTEEPSTSISTTVISNSNGQQTKTYNTNDVSTIQSTVSPTTITTTPITATTTTDHSIMISTASSITFNATLIQQTIPTIITINTDPLPSNGVTLKSSSTTTANGSLLPVTFSTIPSVQSDTTNEPTLIAFDTTTGVTAVPLATTTAPLTAVPLDTTTATVTAVPLSTASAPVTVFDITTTVPTTVVPIETLGTLTVPGTITLGTLPVITETLPANITLGTLPVITQTLPANITLGTLPVITETLPANITLGTLPTNSSDDCCGNCCGGHCGCHGGLKVQLNVAIINAQNL